MSVIPQEAPQIVFPMTATSTLTVPPPPATPMSDGLSQQLVHVPVQEVKRVLTCSALLQGDTRRTAEAEAARLYAEMLANTQVFMNYGTGALKGVNDLVDRLLHEVEPVKIAEATAIMKNLNRGMRGIRSKYDVSDPKVYQKYAEWKGGIGRFFGNAKTLVELLMEDARSIEDQIDRVAAQLKEKREQMLRNVAYYDELYKENDKEIAKLIYAIGVMELIRDLAVQDVQSIVVGNEQLGDRKGEEKARKAEFVSNMDVKIAEYKGRLFVAWATSPQMRMMRTLNVGVAEKLNEMFNVVIPTMKSTLLQWRLLAETMDAADLAELVAQANNQWLQAFAAAGAAAVPRIADAVQTPSLSIASIEAMADSVAKQADGMVAAIEAGAKRRAELDSAMLKARDVLSGASDRVVDAVVQSIVDNANRPLEIASSVPAA